MSTVAESPPLTAESLSGYRKASRAWAAVDDHDEPVGFAVADVIDEAAHIEQVSVHPAHAHQRISASARCCSITWPPGPFARACQR